MAAADDFDGFQGVGVILLRQISESTASLQKDMRDVRDRLIHIESQGAIERIERAEGRIAALESDRDKRTGMTTLTEWFIRSTPWIAAVVLGAVAYVLKGHV